MIDDRILHGGDYNPEQWLECPEVLEEDIVLMKEAGVNCVTLGVFSWAMLEPEEGVYCFDWLKKIMDRLHENGIRVILATPSGAMPHWLTAKYPEVMQVTEEGRRNLPGKRHNFCYTSPVMREKIYKLDTELSRRFGKHEAVVLWHISNEFGGNFGDGACHCERCQEAFREWLKRKYGTLEELNQAWWNRFWSHVYTDWSQIHSPAPNGECLVHGLNLDWKRFVTEQMTDFCEQEIRAVKTCSELPATTNFMDFFKNLDYHRLSQCIDVVSWDNYPNWHIQKDEVPAAVRAAASHSMMRSMKKQPFLLMESTPSCVNWRTVNPVKRPGMHMLSSMQAIAHGSDSVQYFQWRKGRGAYEKFHGAVIGHKNGSNTRIFREVAEVGKRLPFLQDNIRATLNQPKVACIFDWENWWALEDSAGPRQDVDYAEEVLKHYQVFWENGIDVDFINMDAPLDGYRIVCAPLNYLYRKGYAERVRRFVEQGGCFVTTYFSGMVDDTDLCFIGHHPLEDVLGVVQEEIDAPGEEFDNSFIYHGKKFSVGRLREICRPAPDSTVLAVYEQDFYKDFPVVTEHTYGAGKCYYLCAETGLDFLREFYADVLTEKDVKNPLGVDLPYGVTTALRDGEKKNVYVMNFSHEPAVFSVRGRWQEIDTGMAHEGEIRLEGLSCKVLTECDGE